MSKFTIATAVMFEQDIKKSRFQAFAVPVANGQEVKAYLTAQHDPTTTHQCWAWKIGHDVRFNDDGEPIGTAGRPILASIEGNDLTNVLVLVNRWFGGVKLGTGGLVRAYGGCAGQALLLAEKIELIATQAVSLHCLFNEWAVLNYQLKQWQIEFVEQYTHDGVQVECQVKADQLQALADFLQDLTRGREQLKLLDD
ncbi:YigZ family protein [Acinetobacter sp. c2-A9]|uniref:IMPACT family protein n=1 Tax=Acinetobacter sp. c2-A9 TaxID=3342802 RepID=UPI0035B8F61C